jgi:hypothetical protein
MFMDFGLPLLAYYGLRATGVDQWWSLLLSGVIPAIMVVVKLIRTRTADFVAIFVLSIVALSLGISAMTGDARTMSHPGRSCPQGAPHDLRFFERIDLGGAPACLTRQLLRGRRG